MPVTIEMPEIASKALAKNPSATLFHAAAANPAATRL
jgi:hypothetical protein